jgi:hypothetical protein
MVGLVSIKNNNLWKFPADHDMLYRANKTQVLLISFVSGRTHVSAN